MAGKKYTREEWNSLSQSEKAAVLNSLQSAKGGEEIIQKMPEDIGYIERAGIKSVGAGPDEQIAAMKKLYPDKYEYSAKGGQVLLRPKGAKEWNVLDPEGFDIGDITSDIADEAVQAGLTQGAQVVGGALGGMPGASLAGGATSGGLEVLKQFLAKKAGVRESYDPTSIGVATGVGVALPAIFGGGATKSQVANILRKVGKLAPDSSDVQAVQKAFQSQRSLIPKAFPSVMEFLSGGNARIIARGGKGVKNTEQLEKEGVLDFVTEASKDVKDTARQATQMAGKAYEEGLAKSGQMVDMQPYISAYENLENTLKQEIARTGDIAASEELAAVQAELKPLLMRNIVDDAGNQMQVYKDALHPSDLLNFRQRIKEVAETHKVGSPNRFKGKSFGARNIIKTASELESMAGKDLSQLALSPQQKSLSQNYKDALKVEDYLKRKFKDEEKTFRTLSTIGNKAKKVEAESVARIDRTFPGLNLGPKIQKMEDYAFWHDPSLSAISAKGGTSTGRVGASGALGAGLGIAAGNLVGDEMGVPYGGYVGGGLGAAGLVGLTSPAAMRKAFSLGIPQMTSKIGGALSTSGVPVSSWQLMKGEN
jgi:hypothetical protein